MGVWSPFRDGKVFLWNASTMVVAASVALHADVYVLCLEWVSILDGQAFWGMLQQ